MTVFERDAGERHKVAHPILQDAKLLILDVIRREKRAKKHILVQKHTDNNVFSAFLLVVIW